MFHFLDVPIKTSFDRNILVHAAFYFTVTLEVR